MCQTSPLTSSKPGGDRIIRVLCLSFSKPASNQAKTYRFSLIFSYELLQDKAQNAA